METPISGGTWDEGWRAIGTHRKAGATSGRMDVFYLSPEPGSQRLRSIKEVLEFLKLIEPEPSAPQAASASAQHHPAADNGGRMPRGAKVAAEVAMSGEIRRAFSSPLTDWCLFLTVCCLLCSSTCLRRRRVRFVSEQTRPSCRPSPTSTTTTHLRRCLSSSRSSRGHRASKPPTTRTVSRAWQSQHTQVTTRPVRGTMGAGALC